MKTLVVLALIASFVYAAAAGTRDFMGAVRTQHAQQIELALQQ